MLELLSLTRLDGEQRAALGIIRESGGSLLRIIDDILDFSKIEAGKLEVRPEPSSIAKVVERVWNIYSGIASSKGVLLRLQVDHRINPSLLVDPLRLQQILNNLVSNAIKFTHTGHVELKAELVERSAGQDAVRFSVIDTGIGIPEGHRDRLFTPYSQAADNTTQRYGGTGLGLAICSRLAQLMGGALTMESAIGKGTSMQLTLTLPIARTPAPSDGAPSGLASSWSGSPRVPPTIEEATREGTLLLLVEDHPVNRMILLKQVNTLGYAAEVAGNGQEGLDKWLRGGFGAIITDCNMPEMSGYDLARRIRSIEARDGRAHTPIIACTANVLSGVAESCIAAGMDDYLVKPTSLNQLAQKLEQWLPARCAAPV
jgi:CheY-like chemotaxis protein/anti-sigma regulatory factor (Ser/Thr protein kinase)